MPVLHAAETKPQKPNIIFILADDLGIGSVSCYGADHFNTPNIDKLAGTGIRVEHCYSSPLCGPTRAMLLTGRYAFRTGMIGNGSGKRFEAGHEILMPAVLKQAGYVTAQVGKWAQLTLQPSDWGFDEYLRFAQSGKYWNFQRDAQTYTLNGEEVPLKDGEYLPDRMQEFAVEFINRHQNQPFYLYYSMSHVHSQILPTPDSSPENKKHKGKSTSLYQDNVAYMDKLVGKLLAELDRLNLREKTLIIFSSDNGTTPEFKEFCTIDGGKQLSGCKHTMLECGALVPMVISWPGTTAAGQVSNNLISFADIFPTLAEVAGAKLPPGVTIDGRPFTPMLHGQTGGDWVRNWIFVMLENEWYDRELDWKLNQSGELFVMKNAPFVEPLGPATSQDKDALAARQRLQTVLDQLNPAAGKAEKEDNGMRGNMKKTATKQPASDGQNDNAPEE